ncbi:MAG TPA: hypothetical protein VFZ53_05580 [Polyangiaceae bacterium]
MTPVEQMERRIEARCLAAIREAELEEYAAEHGELPDEKPWMVACDGDEP